LRLNVAPPSIEADKKISSFLFSASFTSNRTDRLCKTVSATADKFEITGTAFCAVTPHTIQCINKKNRKLLISFFTKMKLSAITIATKFLLFQKDLRVKKIYVFTVYTAKKTTENC
jgi:hypothetical protein